MYMEGRRDVKGNKPEVVGRSSSTIGHAGAPALGANGDDNKDENDRFDMLVISSSPSDHPIVSSKTVSWGLKLLYATLSVSKGVIQRKN